MNTFRPNIGAINMGAINRVIRNSLTLILITSLLVFETLSAETRYRVRSSDNVNTIVERYYPNSSLTRGQLLVGILIKNPRAFKGGNVNFLLRGKRLILPDENDFQQISPEKASEVLSEHARFFRFGIAGDLPIPTLDEMKGDPEKSKESTNIISKQISQTQKIDLLQQESNELKKQLEALLNDKTERDQRLLELEKSLKKPLVAPKQKADAGGSSQPLMPEQKRSTVSDISSASQNKSYKQEESLNSSKEQINSKKTVDEVIKKDQIIIEPSTNILFKLLWLLPALLLSSLLYFFILKKKRTPQKDDAIKTNELGYIDSYENSIAEFKDSEEGMEESSLETSVKLDVARAYIEAEDTQSALDILSEIMEEGSNEQRQQAHDLLEIISPANS